MLMEGRPFQGQQLEQLKAFLAKMDLQYDEAIEYTVCVLNDDYEIIGTGSVDQNVIKCVAIDPDYQGQGLSARVISALVQYEFEKARTHLFIYTKPQNLRMFLDMGFYTILKTEEVLFMENKAQGFQKFLAGLKEETGEQTGASVGAIVANCNPFTKGHRYLVEEALKQCDLLHLFVLSDNRSAFSAKERYAMVKEGIKDLDRIVLHRTSDYMISAATFPTYFFKDQMQGKQANCKLDLELFAERIAKDLGVTKRFVGTEPFCEVTRAYNTAMKMILPEHGIEVVEIERKQEGTQAVSASEVRRCIQGKNLERLKELVPNAVYAYLEESGRI